MRGLVRAFREAVEEADKRGAYVPEYVPDEATTILYLSTPDDVDSNEIRYGLRIKWICDEGCGTEFVNAWELAGHLGAVHYSNEYESQS